MTQNCLLVSWVVHEVIWKRKLRAMRDIFIPVVHEQRLVNLVNFDVVVIMRAMRDIFIPVVQEHRFVNLVNFDDAVII